jgi:hypothetical protein
MSDLDDWDWMLNGSMTGRPFWVIRRRRTGLS